MVDLYNGLELFTHLAVGLANYERQPAMYPYPKSLQYAINRLAVIAAIKQKPIPNSIYDFLQQASEPLQEWWLGDPQTTLPDEIFLYVPLWADNELHAEVQDYLLADNRFSAFLERSAIEDVQEEIEQKPIRDMLKFARQDPPQFGADYAKARRFIVENPVTDNWTFYEQVNALGLTEPFKNGIEAIYKQASDFSSMTTYNGHYWACPHCGSILTWRGDTPRCSGHAICGKLYPTYESRRQIPVVRGSSLLQVGLGVVRRAVVPGKTEIELHDALVRAVGQGNVELYPGGDIYDLRVAFPDGAIWAIDVKDYTSPRGLAVKLRQEYKAHASRRSDPRLGWTAFYYVVPSYRVQWDVNYLNVFKANFVDAQVYDSQTILQLAKRKINR